MVLISAPKASQYESEDFPRNTILKALDNLEQAGEELIPTLIQLVLRDRSIQFPSDMAFSRLSVEIASKFKWTISVDAVNAEALRSFTLLREMPFGTCSFRSRVLEPSAQHLSDCLSRLHERFITKDLSRKIYVEGTTLGCFALDRLCLRSRLCIIR